MEKNTKKWGLVLAVLGGILCCWKIMGWCEEKCKPSKRKSIIKLKNCNGCWVISFR